MGSYNEYLSLAEPRSEKFLKKLIGRNDIEAALSKLDKLTQEEARMATTQVLKVTSSVDERVKVIAENQLRESLRKWLSPPDPSTNHNTACGAHLKGTATWFFQGSIFQRWKSTNSLLWIHGKRAFLICYPADTSRRSSIFQQALGRVYYGSSDLT